MQWKRQMAVQFLAHHTPAMKIKIIQNRLKSLKALCAISSLKKEKAKNTVSIGRRFYPSHKMERHVPARWKTTISIGGGQPNVK
jgi:hypothetical protein